MARTLERWDSLFRVGRMAWEAGRERPFTATDLCLRCGSVFPAHRCHMEEK